MPHRLLWTPAQDAVLRRLRAEGADWPGIAAAMGLTRNAVTERARRIGAVRQPRPAEPPAEDPARPPMPAGHPRSWGLLTEGTCLAGVPYPLPVFDVAPISAANVSEREGQPTPAASASEREGQPTPPAAGGAAR